MVFCCLGYHYFQVALILHHTIERMLLQLLGGITVSIGLVLIYQQWGNNELKSSEETFGSVAFNTILKFLLYPLLYLLSPIMFLYIKFLSIIKRENKMILYQKEMTSMAEAILEATPQYCLQLNIIIVTMAPTMPQWFTLITSFISLNIPTIQKYYDQHISKYWMEEESKQETVIAKTKRFTKNCLLPLLIIFFNTCGKIFCISIITVLYDNLSYAPFLYFGSLSILLTIQIHLYGLRQERDCNQQRLEAILLGVLSQSNMTNTRCAKMNRMFVFYFSLIFNLIIVLTTMGICNTNPEIYHSNNLFVQNIVMLNIVCSLAVGCLLLSWILDILCQNVSDYGGVFHSLWREIMTPKWEDFLMDIQKAVQENDWLFIIVSLSCYFFIWRIL